LILSCWVTYRNQSEHPQPYSSSSSNDLVEDPCTSYFAALFGSNSLATMTLNNNTNTVPVLEINSKNQACDENSCKKYSFDWLMQLANRPERVIGIPSTVIKHLQPDGENDNTREKSSTIIFPYIIAEFVSEPDENRAYTFLQKGTYIDFLPYTKFASHLIPRGSQYFNSNCNQSSNATTNEGSVKGLALGPFFIVTLSEQHSKSLAASDSNCSTPDIETTPKIKFSCVISMPEILIQFLTKDDTIDIYDYPEHTALILFDLPDDESTATTQENNILMANRILSSATFCAIDRLSSLAISDHVKNAGTIFDPLFTEELKIFILKSSTISLMYSISHNKTRFVVKLRDTIQNAQNERKKIQWLNKVYGLGPQLRLEEEKEGSKHNLQGFILDNIGGVKIFRADTTDPTIARQADIELMMTRCVSKYHSQGVILLGITFEGFVLSSCCQFMEYADHSFTCTMLNDSSNMKNLLPPPLWKDLPGYDGYRAPEIIEKEKAALMDSTNELTVIFPTREMDVYSLGKVFIRLLGIVYNYLTYDPYIPDEDEDYWHITTDDLSKEVYSCWNNNEFLKSKFSNLITSMLNRNPSLRPSLETVSNCLIDIYASDMCNRYNSNDTQ